MTKNRARKYWYYIDIYECPPCGSTQTYRSRRYTKRPASWFKRHEFHVAYDYCLERDYGF